MPKSKEFVSSSEDSGSESEEPKQKKKKVEAKPEKKPDKAEKKPDKAEKKVDKKAGGDEAKTTKTNSNGEQMFQIARMRFATVSEFRGKAMVSIREYYEADGDLRPGKKGISLTMDQWNSLKDQIEDIDEAVKQL
ncbi:activated RNA polymerase II transcriptional coactivator p15-like [Haliotis rubra]|uniref:activated RNA polymerase II transcriptional coactivator p15-like n=1 Tax=Haliotis rubra TaxID=36100 RepID=UPI001EE51640|nr:activated RNA polymerase II transcriptional coactivator p15-like [Haliotis rubra]